MPYYHVHISEVDEVYELDFAKKTLLKCVVEPYLKNQEFFCNGSRIDPSEIEKIRISETETPSKELLPEARPKHTPILGIFGELSDEEIVMKEGKDVTRQFITRLPKTAKQRPLKEPLNLNKNIFIVHGNDHEPLKELKAMLYELGLNPIVLHEQASGGSSTLAEKLDKHASKIGYTFVLLTPDDFGGPAGKLEKTLTYQVPFDIAISAKGVVKDSYGKRARQNVILEFGYFIGKLGRSRVCCLYKGSVELPSDMHGIIYVPFEKSIEEIRPKIIKELKEAGYEIKF